MARRLFLTCLTLFALLSPASARGQVVEAATAAAEGVLLSVALEQIEGTINTAVASVGYEARYTAFGAAQEGHLLIEHFRRAYEGSLDKTIAQLNETEQKAFNDLNFLVGRLNSTLESGAEQASDLIAEFEHAVARLPLAKNDPRIGSYTPKLTSRAALPGQLFLEVKGNLLGQGPAAAVVGERTFEPISQTDRGLTFAIPEEVVAPANDDGTVSFQTVDVRVTKRVCRWIFCLKKENVPVTYRATVYLLPDTIGEYRVTSTVERSVRVTEPRNPGTMVLRSRGHTDRREECFPVHPREGWKIDTGSLAWHTHHVNHGNFNGFRNVTEHGYCVALAARGQGHPFRGRGVITGNPTHVEYRDVQERTLTEVDSGAVVWAEDVEIRLPEGAKDFTLEIRDYTKRTRKVSKVEDLGYAVVEVDGLPVRRVFIKPAQIGGSVVP